MLGGDFRCYGTRIVRFTRAIKQLGIVPVFFVEGSLGFDVTDCMMDLPELKQACTLVVFLDLSLELPPPAAVFYPMVYVSFHLVSYVYGKLQIVVEPTFQCLSHLNPNLNIISSGKARIML